MYKNIFFKSILKQPYKKTGDFLIHKIQISTVIDVKIEWRKIQKKIRNLTTVATH